MSTIYFNRCFTTTSQLIQQLQSHPNGEKHDIVLSHSMPNHYLEEVSNHFEVEPVLSGQPYVGYILNKLQQHDVDFFIPRFQVSTLVHFAHLFQKTSAKTMFVTTPEHYALIDDKVALYEDLLPTNIIPIPDTYTVSNITEFKEAYEKIREQGWMACMKPITGIGGEGFKRIRETISLKDELFLSSAVQISKERVEQSLTEAGEVTPFMMSGFMEGDEYSIDCLAQNGELVIAIPRRKVDKYRQQIEYVPELIEIAKQLTKRYQLSYLYNIQVKYHQGIPYLVEMNTRTSGGLYKAYASNVNMMYEAIRLLQGKEPTVDMNDIQWNVEVYDHLTFGVQLK